MNKNLTMPGICCKISQAGLVWAWLSLCPVFCLPQEPLWQLIRGRGRGRGLKPQADLRPSPTYIPKTHLYDENTVIPPCKLVMSMRSENVEKHLVLCVDPVKGHLMCFYKESENQSSDWRGQVGGIVSSVEGGPLHFCSLSRHRHQRAHTPSLHTLPQFRPQQGLTLKSTHIFQLFYV